MSRRARHCGRIAALPLALALAAAVAAAPAPDARVKASAEQLEQMRARIAELSASLQQDRGRQDDLQNALEDSERAIAAAAGELKRASADVAAQNTKVVQSQNRRDAAQQKLNSEKEALAQQLRAAWTIGSGGRTGLLLQQDDPSAVSRMLGYYDYFNRARQKRMDAIDAELRQLDGLEQQYEAELKSLQTLQAQRQHALAELQDRRDARAQALTAMRHRLNDESVRLGQLQANEKQVQTLLESLQRALADTPLDTVDNRPFPQQRGHLPWPLRGPIIAHYGQDKSGSNLQWKGLWIGADEGAPVRACAGGRVAYVGWMSRYGLIIVVQHSGGYFSLYGHASSVAKTAGDSVAPGEVIAAAGTTGGYDRAGIYLELRKGTDPLNPNDWLRKN